MNGPHSASLLPATAGKKPADGDGAEVFRGGERWASMAMRRG